jgi:hypothetical protein
MVLKLLAAAFAGFAAYRFGQRISEENRHGRRKVYGAPPPNIGVDVSVRE